MLAVMEIKLLGLDHQSARAPGLLDFHFHVAGAIATHATGLAQCLQSADPAFIARTTGLDACANPDLFLGQLLVEFGVLPSLGIQGRLFPIQVRRVVARAACEPAAVEFQNSSRYFTEQGPIVRNEQQRAAITEQSVLQPADRVDIQVVGRLVQQ